MPCVSGSEKSGAGAPIGGVVRAVASMARTVTTRLSGREPAVHMLNRVAGARAARVSPNDAQRVPAFTAPTRHDVTIWTRLIRAAPLSEQSGEPDTPGAGGDLDIRSTRRHHSWQLTRGTIVVVRCDREDVRTHPSPRGGDPANRRNVHADSLPQDARRRCPRRRTPRDPAGPSPNGSSRVRGVRPLEERSSDPWPEPEPGEKIASLNGRYTFGLELTARSPSVRRPAERSGRRGPRGAGSTLAAEEERPGPA